MNSFFDFFIGFIVGAGVVLFLKSGSLNALFRANAARKHTKSEGKEKILRHLAQTRMLSITNRDVERLLGVSDVTATRYLEELEREGKLAQVGKAGRFVSYRLR